MYTLLLVRLDARLFRDYGKGVKASMKLSSTMPSKAYNSKPIQQIEEIEEESRQKAMKESTESSSSSKPLPVRSRRNTFAERKRNSSSLPVASTFCSAITINYELTIF